MTRTLARRLATVGGALGVAVLACAGSASAATAAVSAHADTSTVATASHTFVTDDRDRHCGCRPDGHGRDGDRDRHHGLVGDAADDLGRGLHDLL